MRTFLERHGYLFAVGCIAVSTLIFLPGRSYFAKGQWALLYLPTIVLVASMSGVRPALLAAGLAFLAWNFFFLPPYHTLVIADPKDWLSLIVFLLVGAAMGLQTGRMKERESEALEREKEAILLNKFSGHLVSQTSTSGMAEMLLSEIAEVTGAPTALYRPDESGKLVCFRASPGLPVDDASSVSKLALWVYQGSKAIGLPQTRDITRMGLDSWPISVSHDQAPQGVLPNDLYLPMQTSSRMEGVLYVGGQADGTPYSPQQARLIVSIANQAAGFLERRHLQDAANQADALLEADRLKSSFVSSISHELKTPLASVTATITGLLEGDVEWDSADLRRDLESVADDLNRLNASIRALLDFSRLEADAWSPKKDSYEFGEILGTAISKLPEQQRARIIPSLPDDLPNIDVDFLQWARVLENLLENALAYSPPDRQLRVGALSTSKEIRMWVEDEGPGVNAQDKPHVFDKFYRGRAAAGVPSGTGLGLAIAKEIVRFHGGRIWIEDVDPHGARFVIALPRIMDNLPP